VIPVVASDGRVVGALPPYRDQNEVICSLYKEIASSLVLRLRVSIRKERYSTLRSGRRLAM